MEEIKIAAELESLPPVRATGDLRIPPSRTNLGMIGQRRMGLSASMLLAAAMGGFGGMGLGMGGFGGRMDFSAPVFDSRQRFARREEPEPQKHQDERNAAAIAKRERKAAKKAENQRRAAAGQYRN